MLGVLFVLNQPNTTMSILLREMISLEIPFQEHKHKQILQFDLVSSLQNAFLNIAFLNIAYQPFKPQYPQTNSPN